MVPCGSSPVTRLYLAKNEAPEEEAELIGLDPVIHTTKKAEEERWIEHLENYTLWFASILPQYESTKLLRERGPKRAKE